MNFDTRKVIRIFLASPGGLDDERQLANRIVGQINKSHADKWGSELELIGWEHTLPNYDRAQSVINRDLDKCQYFIGLIWDHWGSPPAGSEGNYTSGFEEEFERAKRHKTSGAIKDIALYFKEIPSDKVRDPGQSLKKVLEFRETIIGERKPLFVEFSSLDTFGELLRRYLEDIGWKESQLLEELNSRDSRSIQPDDDHQVQSETANQNGLIENSACDFLTGLIQKPNNWDAISPVEIARLRLLGVANSRHGNDEVFLGNHDANLLYGARKDTALSIKECRALLDTGINGYGHQNVPLWHWLVEYERPNDLLSRAEALSWFGDGALKRNAIRLLQLMNAPVPTPGDTDRNETLKQWLLDEDNPDVCKAGLSYLKTNGIDDDIEFLIEHFGNFSDQHKEAATEAATYLALRKGREVALKLLIRLDPNSINESLANILFDEPEALSTEILKKCVELKADLLRKASVAELIEREALDTRSLRDFISDNDFSIRRIAIQRLVAIDPDFPKETIRQALVKRDTGLGSFFSLSLGARQPDESEYELYKRYELESLEYSELLERFKKASIFDELEVDVFFNRFGKRHGDELRKYIKDGFKSYFNGKLEEFEKQLGQDAAAQIEKTRNFSDSIRQNLTSAALDNLCKLNKKSDLALVRCAATEHEPYFSETVLSFLGRHGGWNDMDTILSYQDKFASGKTPFGLYSNSRYPKIAAALYGVGRSRLTDLLRLEIRTEILAGMFDLLTQKDVRSLDTAFLVELLNCKHNGARIILSKKCAVHLTKAELKVLLESYCEKGRSRYYNVIHWLDLGIAMPKAMTRKIVKASTVQ